LRAAVPRGHILDAGCGAGSLTELLARRGYRVTAVDASEEFVAYVRERVSRASLAPRVTVQQADLEQGKLPTNAFDGAVCGEVLEHLADDAAATRAIAGALRPGGVLALTVPARPEQYDWLDHWAGHERRYDEPALRSLLAGTGLEVDTLVQWGFPFMALYERFVQRPGLARVSRERAAHGVVTRLARAHPTTLVLGALFRLDERFEGHSTGGTGFLARARKPL
jgi:SAM-dependent methyltransferase